jgi:hypothetical protein
MQAKKKKKNKKKKKKNNNTHSYRKTNKEINQSKIDQILFVMCSSMFLEYLKPIKLLKPTKVS